MFESQSTFRNFVMSKKPNAFERMQKLFCGAYLRVFTFGEILSLVHLCGILEVWVERTMVTETHFLKKQKNIILTGETDA